MIIDFHTHFYPEKIAGRALSALTGFPGMAPFTDGTLNGLTASMRNSGIAMSLGLPLANTPDNVHGINRWAALHHKPPCLLTGSIHPDVPEPGKVVRWISSLGLGGLKLHPEYQNFRFSERRLWPVWEACLECDMFVITHAGADACFRPPFHSNPAELAELHRNFPELKLALAHLGSWGMWDEVEQHLCGLPVYFDTAFIAGYLPPEQAARIILRHGADKVLFGSDSPWQDQATAVQYIKSLPLPPEAQAQILCRNAMKLLKLQAADLPENI